MGCNCGNKGTVAQKYDIFNPQGQLVDTVDGEYNARVAVTRLGPGSSWRISTKQAAAA